MAAGLTLAVLGVPDLRFGGATVSLPAKSLALVIYLAMTVKRARREVLADMFWGDTGEDGARANLRLALSKLRQTLPGVLEADGDSVGLAAAALLDVDALQLLHTVDTLLQQPLAAQEAAMARYRGSFLQDFTLRDCAGFEDWVTAERQRIDRRAVVLLRELVQGARRAAKPAQEVRYLGQWARIEPWNEEAQLPLIKLLAQAGSTAAALDSFEQCRLALAEELGARPSVALALLAEQVRRGELGLQRAPATVTSANAAVAVAPAASPPMPMYGRDADLRLVSERVVGGDRLVTLLGPAGVGKSRLARALADDLAEHFPDGQVACRFDFMDSGIDEEASEDHFVGVVGSALGLDLSQTNQPLAMLKNHLATRRIILGLDGFEACPKAAPAVVEMLEAAPQCLLMVTSRTRLATTQGWTHELKGLTAPSQTHGRDPGVELLLHCARLAGVTLDAVREHDTLTRLVQLLDGSPLAIQFAAQSLRVLPTEQLVHKLEQGNWQESRLHVPGYRYNTLQDVMADTWSQLEPALREAWARCALFKGGFALDWAHDCAGVNDHQAALLVERSILGREAPGRLSMHAMARQYGLQMLDTLPQADAHRRVFASAALRRLLALSPQLVREDGAAAVDALRPEIATLAAAFDLALHWEQPEEINPPLQAMLRVYHRLGWSHAATRLIEAVLARHAQAPAAWRIIWHHMGAEIVHNQHGHQVNSEHFRSTLTLAGAVLPAGGYSGWLSGAASLCRALVARPLAKALDRDAQAALAHSLLMLLTVRYANGAGTPEMFACLCAAILAARRSGHPEARLEVMVKLMAFEKLGGRPRVYAAMLRRMRRDLKDATPAYEARVLKGMNEAMIAMGEWDAAVSCLRRASAQLAALGYRYEVLECTGRVNSVLQHTGDFRQLLDNVWEDERVARRLEQSTILRWTLLFKMQAWLRTGSGTLDAAEHCLRAIHAIPTHRTQLEEIRLWANEALVLAVRGDVDGVIQRAQDILDLSRNMSSGRFYLMAPMAVIADAMLFLAFGAPAGSSAHRLGVNVARRYDHMTRGITIFAPRRLYYMGVAAVLQGHPTQAVQLWEQGLHSCAADDLRYDRARLHWMLSLYADEATRAGHARDAAAHFDHCGVIGPVYPFMPVQRVDRL